MSLKREADGRLHIETPLMAESLMIALARARSMREVLLVDGREPGSLTRALAGENPGTRITCKL